MLAGHNWLVVRSLIFSFGQRVKFILALLAQISVRIKVQDAIRSESDSEFQSKIGYEQRTHTRYIGIYLFCT